MMGGILFLGIVNVDAIPGVDSDIDNENDISSRRTVKNHPL
jgi:hypothetical protein